MMTHFEYPWKKNELGHSYAGQPSGPCPQNMQERLAWLLKQRVHFGYIIEDENNLFACVDRTRSYPVFYTIQNNEIFLADHPNKLCTDVPKNIDTESAALFLSSGYCPQNKSLYKNIFQLQAGEYLNWDKKNKQLQIEAYYHYIPLFPAENKSIDYKKQLDDVLNAAIARVIAQAQGRKIYVPLSGGLDSRLVLAKLHAQGYPHLYAFSYGAEGNTEAQTAAKIVKTLDVPWEFIKPDYKAQKEFFESQAGTDFILKAARGSNGPSFTDFFALQKLALQNKLGPDILIVNGQSGDFLTGGHLPTLQAINRATIQTAFAEKHFSLWHPLKTAQKNLLENFFDNAFAQFSGLSPGQNLYAFHSWLEWRERQSKYVVACQYNYDYFKTDWALPLWDANLMDFYQTLPFDLYFGQKLYIDYLQSWNYKNLFSFIRAPYNPWPKNRWLILSLGRVIGALTGQKNKNKFYNYMRYYSSHDVHYKLMPFKAWHMLNPLLSNAEGFYALTALLRADTSLNFKKNGFKAYDDFINQMRDIFK